MHLGFHPILREGHTRNWGHLLRTPGLYVLICQRAYGGSPFRVFQILFYTPLTKSQYIFYEMINLITNRLIIISQEPYCLTGIDELGHAPLAASRRKTL